MFFYVHLAPIKPTKHKPMKTKLFTTFVLAIYTFSHCQVGVNTPIPHPSAAFEIYSNNKGFLPPRLTTAQRDAIATKPAGLMIYNSDDNCMQYWNSIQWIGNCTPGGAGTITDCMAGALSGTYTQGTAMTSGNTVVLAVNATQVGSWTATSATVNGVTFNGSGIFTVTGNQNITLTASGIPTASGTFTFPFILGSSTCSRNITFSSSLTVLLPGNSQPWLRHNLGANTSLDPDIPVEAIHGNYYQWGRPTVVANTTTPPGAIAGWNTSNAADGSWLDSSKTVNDPCPSGFRVPTSQQWQNMLNNTTASNLGTFTDSPSNFGSAKVFTSGSNKMTLPTSGGRANADGSLLGRGNSGDYWSSTQSTSPYSFLLAIISGSPAVTSTGRVAGFSIRCISE